MVIREMRISEEIKVSLERNDRSLKWLSEKTGIPYQTLTRRIKHPAQFTVRELLLIEELFGVNLMTGLSRDV
ncbi:hypothetical protein [Lysinibacter sp. HNR]|uniref:hypothetical protein n=1 Tax=Lysinibacter sp. HNR TaxID=3031408 RepID=UPI002434B730|nr:hypothetical protein [Lysinibacter sp. HNR]WGD37551.1 hypothetical protein FrondiHNR_01105 [Lysinibacter sp. HNR]